MQEFITGYYYGDGGQYRGPFVFPNNLDKEEIHVPPSVTLVEPPEVTGTDWPFWDTKTESWVLKRNPNIPLTAYCWDEGTFIYAGTEDIYGENTPPPNGTFKAPIFKNETDVMVWTGKKWSVKK